MYRNSLWSNSEIKRRRHKNLITTRRFQVTHYTVYTKTFLKVVKLVKKCTILLEISLTFLQLFVIFRTIVETYIFCTINYNN